MLINLNTSLIMILLRNGMTKSANIVAKHTKWSRAVAQRMERPVHIVKSYCHIVRAEPLCSKMPQEKQTCSSSP